MAGHSTRIGAQRPAMAAALLRGGSGSRAPWCLSGAVLVHSNLQGRGTPQLAVAAVLLWLPCWLVWLLWLLCWLRAWLSTACGCRQAAVAAVLRLRTLAN